MKTYIFILSVALCLFQATFSRATIVNRDTITIGERTAAITGATSWTTLTIDNPTVVALSSVTGGVDTVWAVGLSQGIAIISHLTDTAIVVVVGFQASFYMDINGNCVKDAGEPYNTQPIFIKVDSGSVTLDTVSVIGGIRTVNYGVPSTVYTFTMLPSNLYISCPSSGIVYDTVGVDSSKMVGLSVAPTPPGMADFGITVSMSPTGKHRQEGYIYVRNDASIPSNATVTMHYSPKFTIVYATSPTATVSGNTLTWNLTGLSATAGTATVLYFHLERGGSLPVGDTVHEDFSVTATAGGDTNLTNNMVIRIDTVKSGYDPNYVEVLPSSCFNNDTTFICTIHFENTGNDTAHNIFVLDTLSANLNPSSLQLLDASHYMDVFKYKWYSNMILKFDFPKIKLLDSSHHGLCDGFVQYKIKNKAGIPASSTILHRAGIYFDDNPVVLTNGVVNTKGCPPAGVNYVGGSDEVTLYPNPATNELVVAAAPSAYDEYTVFNLLGKSVIHDNISNAQTAVNIEKLPAGVYCIMLRGDKQTRVLKFVKE